MTTAISPRSTTVIPILPSATPSTIMRTVAAAVIGIDCRANLANALARLPSAISALVGPSSSMSRATCRNECQALK